MLAPATSKLKYDSAVRQDQSLFRSNDFLGAWTALIQPFSGVFAA